MSDKTPWGRHEGMAESDPAHSWLVKMVIVMIVFPVLLVTLMQPWKLVIYGLAWLLPADAAWAHWFGLCAVVVGTILAGWGALRVCRLIWPKPTTSSHAWFNKV